MAKPRIDDISGFEAVKEALDRIASDTAHASVGSVRPDASSAAEVRGNRALAVRWLLQQLERKVPGKTVEVRVPPFGAVQIVDALSHTRGTPPNVIETDADTFILMATGRLDFDVAHADARVRASGTRATLAPYLPVVRA